MASIQQIRAVEREIRANKDLLEREQSALNESLSKKSKLDYQIKNSLRERAEKISRLNSKINGLDAVIKKTEHEIQQEKNSISARITATGLEANKNQKCGHG
jgi:peptidoglycan hydrolase CwlO-like protein